MVQRAHDSSNRSIFCPESLGNRLSSRRALRVIQPPKSSQLFALTMNLFNISFLIPGYLPPGRLVEPDTVEFGSSAPVAMQWESGLVQQPWQAKFEQHLGLVGSSGLHLPMARLMCSRNSETNGLVCADPIHLQPDRDTAKLLPAEMLDLSEEEAERLLMDINAFLLADNMVLSRRQGLGWYLSGMDASQLESFPPSFLANRNASAYLPEGEDSGQWRRLMTELQMLLHAHPVNEEREQLGKQPVNSLWFWGGAPLYSSLDVAIDGVGHADTLTVTALGSATGTVYADDEFTRAACADLQLPCKALEDFDPLFCEDSLVVDTRIANAIFARNESEMHRVIEEIDQQWLELLGKRINQGEIQQISIENEDGDKGVLTRDLQRVHSRSENRFYRALLTIKLPAQLKRWFNKKKQG
ncbi:MAG: hypothetical protein ACJAZF_001926 [Granulosicoccus sp.]|jgi:hypothetical protein